MTPRAREEKFLHRGSLERVLYRGSMDVCVDPLLDITHHNDSCTVEVWRSSYIEEVHKGSYTVVAWMIVLIRCWVLSTIMIPTPWKCGDVAFERAAEIPTP
nr:hypothetical protein CFP56_59167 [Quercus suber]